MKLVYRMIMTLAERLSSKFDSCSRSFASRPFVLLWRDSDSKILYLDIFALYVAFYLYYVDSNGF